MTGILIGLGVAAALFVATLFAIANRPPSTLDQLLDKEVGYELVQIEMASGCTAAGALDPGIGPAIAASKGMVCSQILGKTLINEEEGKGFCKADDKKCLFTEGFVVTRVRAMDEMPQSEADRDKLQNEINAAYEKINSTKELQ